MVDPRFDDLSGSFDEDSFRHAYGFLSDQRTGEIAFLAKQAKKLKKQKKSTIRVEVKLYCF